MERSPSFLRTHAARILAELTGLGLREQRIRDHLSYLEAAVGARRPELFGDYVAWRRQLERGRGHPEDELRAELQSIEAVIRRLAPAQEREACVAPFASGVMPLADRPYAEASFLEDGRPHVELARRYLALLIDGRRKDAIDLVLAEVERGLSIPDLYLHVFQATQWEVGRLWQRSELAVGQEHYCTAATQAVMAQLYPRIFGSPRNGRRLLATTIQGNLHELGIHMVADFFEMEGWDTHYVGADASIESILSVVREQKPEVIALSATLPAHLPGVAELVRRARSDALPAAPRLMVGGHAFNAAPDLWRELGADAYAADAAEAVRVARRWAAS